MAWWMWLLAILVLLSLVILIVLLILWSRRRQDFTPEAVQEMEPAAKAAEAVVEERAEETIAEIEQAAAELAKDTDLQSSPRMPEAVSVIEPADDLKIIEGIGPKISSVFQAAGITTLAQLAETEVDDLKRILTEANIRLGDPSTWPEQARLAAEAKWDELASLQNSLKGGRRV